MSSEQEVNEAFFAVRDALSIPDPEALSTLIAEDYRGFDLRGGIETRDAILEYYQPGICRLTGLETTDLRTFISGDLGIVTGIGVLSGEYGTDSFHHTVCFCDMFVRRDKRWQLLFSQTTEVQPTEQG